MACRSCACSVVATFTCGRNRNNGQRACPYCADTALRIKATYEHTVKHTRLGAHLMVLHLRVPKYHCKRCHRYRFTFPTSYPPFACVVKPQLGCLPEGVIKSGALACLLPASFFHGFTRVFLVMLELVRMDTSQLARLFQRQRGVLIFSRLPGLTSDEYL